MKRQGQFEIFHGKKRKRPQGFAARARVNRNANRWFARFRAANGKIVWRTSEGYNRRRDALNAIRIVAGSMAKMKGELDRQGNLWVLK